jgi:hypothetical protein
MLGNLIFNLPNWNAFSTGVLGTTDFAGRRTDPAGDFRKVVCGV